MKKIIDWIFTVPFFLIFLAVLCVFQVIVGIFSYFGERAFFTAYSMLNFCVIQSLRVAGTKISLKNFQKLPTDRPIILVSNHQSMFDIPILAWQFRKHRPRFIAKRELAKGVPAVSISLRKGAGLLIDRGNPKNALREMLKYGRQISEDKSLVCIFPEGTRAKEGKMKQFKEAGLSALMKSIPEALVIPVAIENSWKLLEHKLFPTPFGTELTFTQLEPIEPNTMTPSQVTKQAEQLIAKHLGQEGQQEEEFDAKKDKSTLL